MKVSKFLPLIIVAALAACGEKPAPQAEATAAPAASAPVEAPAAAAPAAAPAEAPAAAPAAAASAAASAPAGDLALGEKIYGTSCASCHGAGVLGAPKSGDKAAWGPRIAQGKDTLYNHGLNGFKMMPAKGGNTALKDDEVKAAIDYMISTAS